MFQPESRFRSFLKSSLKWWYLNWWFLIILGTTLVLIVMAGFVINRNWPKWYQSEEMKRAQTQESLPVTPEQDHQSGSATSYQVKQGDSLWKIAEQTYGDGRWHVFIAQINGLGNGNELNAGSTLQLPPLAVVQPEGLLSTEKLGLNGPEFVSDTQVYIVRPGDTLSEISVRAYGDIRMWPILAQANQKLIANPDCIYPGMVVSIPVSNNPYRK